MNEENKDQNLNEPNALRDIPERIPRSVPEAVEETEFPAQNSPEVTNESKEKEEIAFRENCGGQCETNETFDQAESEIANENADEADSEPSNETDGGGAEDSVCEITEEADADGEATASGGKSDTKNDCTLLCENDKAAPKSDASLQENAACENFSEPGNELETIQETEMILTADTQSDGKAEGEIEGQPVITAEKKKKEKAPRKPKEKKPKLTAAEKKELKASMKAEKAKNKKREKESAKNQKIIDRQKAKIAKKHSASREREIPFTEKLLKFLKKFWWVFLIAALVIAIAVTGTVHVLNKDYIFVSNENDFNRIEDGNVFILQKDVIVEGDLTLNVPYSIDLAGHTLTVNGKLTVDLGGTSSSFAVGSRKNADFVAGGTLDAESVEIIGESAKVTLAAKIRTNNLFVKANNLLVSGEMLVYSGVKLTANEITSAGNYSFSAESGSLSLTAERGYFSSQVLGASVEFTGNRFEMSASARTSDVFLSDGVSLVVYGKIERLLSGGARVELGEGSGVNKIEKCDLLRIYESASYRDIDGSVNKLVYVKKLSTPKDITTYSSGGRIYCVTESVANADTYIFTVGDAPAVKSKSNVFDITEYVISAGNYTIKVQAANEESNADAQYIISDVAEYLYQSVIKLSTPMNLSVKLENGRVMLRFDTVPLAGKYVITINETELQSFEANGGESQVFDLTSFILLDNDKKKGAGKYVIKVKATSDLIKNFTPSDENSITYHHYVKLTRPEIKAVEDEEGNVTLSWKNAENAKYYKIYEIKDDGTYVWLQTTSQTSISVQKNKRYAVIAEGNGYYTDSDATVWEAEAI